MNSKTILVALLVIVGLLSVVTQYLNPQQFTVENFLGMSGAVGVPTSNPFVETTVEGSNDKPVKVASAIPQMMSGPTSFFTVPGQYQSQLSPRMGSPQGLTANVRSNLDKNHLAFDSQPLSSVNLANVVEGFEDRLNTPTGDYSKQQSNLVKAPGGDIVQLPSLNMTTASSEGQGVEGQPIVFDRLIVGLRNNRLFSQGDFIRGDLPIVPCATGWFRPSAVPNQSLNPGALAVMGGAYSETSRQNAGLQMMSTAGAQTTLSGVDYKPLASTPIGEYNMQMERQTTLGSQAAGSNIQVGLFP
jgi:hypothetical protein